ncbi:MAG: hypothetical protein ABIQ60_15370, partial [Burkholderiaceae bacterium]
MTAKQSGSVPASRAPGVAKAKAGAGASAAAKDRSAGTVRPDTKANGRDDNDVDLSDLESDLEGEP